MKQSQTKSSYDGKHHFFNNFEDRIIVQESLLGLSDR
jgi:hypothetical protein